MQLSNYIYIDISFWLPTNIYLRGIFFPKIHSFFDDDEEEKKYVRQISISDEFSNFFEFFFFSFPFFSQPLQANLKSLESSKLTQMIFDIPCNHFEIISKYFICLLIDCRETCWFELGQLFFKTTKK